jgi:hypothetical protein
VAARSICLSRRKAALQEFLLASFELPFVYGRRDCALWACDFIQSQRGVDPGAAFRGRYKTRLGCARLLKRQGGLLTIASDAFAAAGLCTTAEIAPGDVGCIQTPAGPVLMLATLDGRWAWFRDHGFDGVAGVTVLRAWKV